MDASLTDAYPEHAKLDAVKDISQAIGEFLDYGLAAQGLVVAQEARGGRLVPTHRPISEILARYFEIDQAALEAEKQAMLDALRKANEGRA
jgi:hypothetical protein